MTIFDSLHYYEALSPEAKDMARSQVIAFEIDTNKRKYRELLTDLKMKSVNISYSINALINDPYHISHLVSKLLTVRYYQQLSTSLHDTEHLIDQNRCMFDDTGRYYIFTQHTFYR